MKLFGICYEPVSMVMEYVPRGDLHRLLVSTQMAHVACSHPSHDHIKPIGGLSPAPVKQGTPHSFFFARKLPGCLGMLGMLMVYVSRLQAIWWRFTRTWRIMTCARW